MEWSQLFGVINAVATSAVAPFAIKFLKNFFEDRRRFRTGEAKKLIVSVPIDFDVSSIGRIPVVTSYRDARLLQNSVIFVRYHNIAKALRQSDYVFCDEKSNTNPKFIFDKDTLAKIVSSFQSD